jgi:hypothetical protein
LEVKKDREIENMDNRIGKLIIGVRNWNPGIETDSRSDKLGQCEN